MNNLDAFNKDKVKCKKCKDYFDKKEHPGFLIETSIDLPICENCNEKWTDIYWSNPIEEFTHFKQVFERWCNYEQ
jgi:hypothetical protein